MAPPGCYALIPHRGPLRANGEALFSHWVTSQTANRLTGEATSEATGGSSDRKLVSEQWLPRRQVSLIVVDIVSNVFGQQSKQQQQPAEL